MFKLFDGRIELYQWDLDRKVIVSDPSIVEVHFCNKESKHSLITEVYELDGQRVADIPNILLQDIWPIKAYGQCGECYVKAATTFNVVRRAKPDDYVYTETDVYKVGEVVAQMIADWEERVIENTSEEVEKAVHEILGSEVDDLKAANEDNADAIGTLRRDYEASVIALQKADRDNAASISANGKKIAELNSAQADINNAIDEMERAVSNGVSASINAQSVANNAVATANNAAITANAALELANEIQGTAINAVAAANNAQETSNNALELINEAHDVAVAAQDDIDAHKLAYEEKIKELEAADATKFDIPTQYNDGNNVPYYIGSTKKTSVAQFTDNASAWTIAYRGNNGTLKVGTPINSADATPKSYVDGEIGPLADSVSQVYSLSDNIYTLSTELQTLSDKHNSQVATLEKADAANAESIAALEASIEVWQKGLGFDSLASEIIIFFELNSTTHSEERCRNCHLIKVSDSVDFTYATDNTYTLENQTKYIGHCFYITPSATHYDEADVELYADASGFNALCLYDSYSNEPIALLKDDFAIISIVSAKAPPQIVIPSGFTVTINNTSDPATYSENYVSYSVNGGAFTYIRGETTILENVETITFRDEFGGGGYLNANGNSTDWDVSMSEYTHTVTEDTTFELYISW